MVDEDDPGAGSPSGKTPGRLRDRAFGEAAESFGKEIAPLGKEVGGATARMVRVSLRGLSAVISGAEQVLEWMETAVIDRLKGVPENELAAPSPRITLPALQGAVFASEEEEAPIREMFANLIAKDMTKQGKLDVHPSFVEIVKQLSTDDAKMLQYIHQRGPQILGEIRFFKNGNKAFQDIGTYITISIGNVDAERNIRSVYSLARLGIIDIADKQPNRPEFDDLEKSYLQRSDVREYIEDSTDKVVARKRGLYLTPFGETFVRVCLG